MEENVFSHTYVLPNIERIFSAKSFSLGSLSLLISRISLQSGPGVGNLGLRSRVRLFGFSSKLVALSLDMKKRGIASGYYNSVSYAYVHTEAHLAWKKGSVAEGQFWYHFSA